MLSNAQRMFAGFSWSSLWKLVDLRQRLTFTLFMIVVYRFGTRLLIPGVDFSIMDAQIVTGNSYLNILNTLAGGALTHAAVMALGIMPFITAGLAINLLTIIDDSWTALRKEGEAGRAIIDQYTRQTACALAVAQSMLVVYFLESHNVVLMPGFLFRVNTILTVVSGSMFLIWMADQISKMGIGRGSSVILCIGILSDVPQAVTNIIDNLRIGNLAITSFLSFAVFFLAVLAFIVFFESAQRRILIVCPKMMPRMGMIQNAESLYLPMKANVVEISPVIFANLVTGLIARSFIFVNWAAEYFEYLDYVPGIDWLPTGSYTMCELVLIMTFTIIWGPYTWSPEENAERLNKEAKFIPGVRPGNSTVEYLWNMVLKISIISGVYLCILNTLPDMICDSLFTPLAFRGISMLIVVNVIIETINQISTYIMTMHYQRLEEMQKKMMKRKRP